MKKIFFYFFSETFSVISSNLSENRCLKFLLSYNCEFLLKITFVIIIKFSYVNFHYNKQKPITKSLKKKTKKKKKKKIITVIKIKSKTRPQTHDFFLIEHLLKYLNFL